jgi:hypothetical protein
MEKRKRRIEHKRRQARMIDGEWCVDESQSREYSDGCLDVTKSIKYIQIEHQVEVVALPADCQRRKLEEVGKKSGAKYGPGVNIRHVTLSISLLRARLERDSLSLPTTTHPRVPSCWQVMAKPSASIPAKKRRSSRLKDREGKS